MNIYLNVNTDKVVLFTNKLEKIRKVELPIAIRGALNSAAFDVKQRTMIQSSEAHFIKRKPNFFKANSHVEMAKGLDIRTMKAAVGFMPSRAAYNNKAVEELHQQEYGGDIGDRTLIPTEGARVGGNATAVRPKNRLKTIGSQITRAIDVKNIPGPNRRYKFMRAANKAGRGGYVIAGLRKRMVYRIDSISRKYGRTFVKQTALYSFDKGRSVKIDSTGFMREASLRSAGRLEKFYIAEANRRIAKMKK